MVCIKQLAGIIAILTACTSCGCSSWRSNLSGVKERLANSLLPDNISENAARKVLSGPAHTTETSPSQVTQVSPAKTPDVRVDGRMAVVGDARHHGLSVPEFVTQISGLLEREHYRSAQAVTMLHLNTATSWLENRWYDPLDADFSVLQFVARSLDEQLRCEVGQGYLALLQMGLPGDATANQYVSLRNQVQQRLQAIDTDAEVAGQTLANQFTAAADMLQHPLLRIESRRLASIVLLLDGDPAAGLQQMVAAAEIAHSSGHWRQASACWLSACDLARRAADQQTEAIAWQRAIGQQLDSYQNGSGLFDLEFWLDADEVRPAEAAWPERCQELLIATADLIPEHIPKQRSQHEQIPAALSVRLAIAAGLLERGEPQAALVHIKQAAVLASVELQPWLRIAEAKCLVAIGAQPAGIATLLANAQADVPQIRRASMAALGSIRLHSGAFQQGYAALGKAFETENTERAGAPPETNAPETTERESQAALLVASNMDWPGATAALADYALAMIIVGQIESGLEHLRLAQKYTLSTANQKPARILQYRQMLENEIRFCNAEQRLEEAQRASSRLRDFESANQQLAAKTAP